MIVFSLVQYHRLRAIVAGINLSFRMGIYCKRFLNLCITAFYIIEQNILFITVCVYIQSMEGRQTDEYAGNFTQFVLSLRQDD